MPHVMKRETPVTTSTHLPRARLTRAATAILEALERRTLMTATLGLTNPFALPSSDRLIFNTMGNLNSTTPTNVVHSQQTLKLSDTGTTALTIGSLALSGPFAFVGAPAGGYSNTIINAGSSLTVTIAFTQSSVPAHTVNETNFGGQYSNVNGGAEIGGSLTITSNDATTPTKVVSLAGYYQQVSNNNEEPSLQTIVNRLAGYQTNIGVNDSSSTTSLSNSNANDVDLTQPDVNGTPTAKLYGNEVYSPSWEQAVASQPVSIQQIDAFHTQGNTATLYWYTASTQAHHQLFRSTGAQGQSLLPTTSDGNSTPLTASFSPGVAFGLEVDSEYSNDAINAAAGNTGGGGHHFRFFPLVDENGNAVANSYIVAMDYGVAQSENFDFQDNVYVVSNIRPSGTPGTPANLTATNGATPTLSWTADSYSPVAYNVYRATSAGGAYTLLTSTAQTGTTYTDSSAPAGTLYYEVTAVDTTQSPVATSAPATVVANAGPISAPYTFSATSGVVQVINPLANVTDATGTVVPATVLISTAPAHGGTAIVNTSNGDISYTPSSSFTGTETLAYTVADSNGMRSLPATITFNVLSTAGTTTSGSSTSAPLTNTFVGQTLENTPITISVLSADTAATTFPATNAVKLVGAASDGNAVANPDGTITYTPGTNFVGGDSFTYTATDANGQTSATTTVDVNVGVAVGSTSTYHTLSFKDTDGTQATVSLTRGVADVYFDGIGTAIAPTRGKVLMVAGTGMHIRTIALSGTTAASTLTIAGARNGAVTFGGVYDTGTLGVLNARTSNLVTNGGSSTSVPGNAYPAGYINLAGVRSISLKSAGISTSGATIILGNAGVAGTSVSFAGPVAATTLTSAAPITSLKATSWTDASATFPGPITAPSISSLTVPGEFDADLTLTAAAGRVPALGSARVGPVNDGLWSIAGNVGSITFASAGANFGGFEIAGAARSVTVVKGNLSSDVNAATINALKVAGTLTANVHTAGNLLSLTAGSLNGSEITVGTAADLADVTAADIGAAILGTLRVTGKGTVFSDASVVADVIKSATLGGVNLTGVDEGIATHSIKSLVVSADNGITHLPAAALTSEAVLTAYLSAHNLVFGTLQIAIV